MIQIIKQTVIFNKFFFIAVILIIGLNNSIYSQNARKISGKVSDSKDNYPIEAEVKLFPDNDTTILSQTRCDTTGIFSFTSLSSGEYRLEVSYPGYAKLKIDKISLTKNNNELVYDTLKLRNQEIVTDEILVEDEKKVFTIVGDKKIFNVDKSIVTRGGTALDVLKKVPLVDVDMNDNVSLRGSQNVKILIDDKPSKFVNLKQLPGESIERVELITNPSAKYEAEGVTGIINLVLKKGSLLGFNGSTNLSVGTKDKYNGGLNLNFKKDKWSMFSGVYAGIFNLGLTQSGLSEYLTPPVNSTKFDGTGKIWNRWYYLTGGIEYEALPGNTFGMEGFYSDGKFKQDIFSDNQNLDSIGNLTSSYTRNNVFDGLWRSYSAGLYYNGKLDAQGRELSGDFTISGNRNDFYSYLTKTDFYTNAPPPLQQKDHTNNKSTNINAQLDYVHPLSQLTRIEAGYKGTFRINDNDFTSDTIDHTTNNYVNNIYASNRFKLNEGINAVYAVFSSSIGNFSYKLGLRTEYTNTKGELINTGYNFTKSYIDFFPTINLSYKTGITNQVQLSYSRRVTRPGIFRLNPFKLSYDPKYVIFGNPDLNPEYTDSYELSYVFVTDYITITPLAFYRQAHDVISQYTYTDSNNVANTTFRNAAGSKAYGLDIILNSRTFPWLNLNGTLSLYDTKFDKDIISDYTQEEGFSWKANIRSTVIIGTLFTLELYYNYVGKK